MFLLLDVPEALYGGAVGGGKTAALLMGALQYVDVPGYAALILRRTFPELEQPEGPIWQSMRWFGDLPKNVRPKYTQADHIWRFPSGAVIRFGHLDSTDGVMRYQGGAYHFVGFDELTHFEESQYDFIGLSRQRKPASGPLSHVPIRVRATANPGGPGHEWVKSRFLTDRDNTRAAFVPAKLYDNPGIDADDYLSRLRNMNPVMQQQLIEGDWDVFALSGEQYFDVDALFWYRANAVSKIALRGEFIQERGKGRFAKLKNGPVIVYRKPKKDRKYGIGADVATGRGKDFSSAFVIDLSEMEICAEIHGKLDADLFARQLHFVGRWYNDAKLAVETVGVGEAVIIPLRDGLDGRPPYPNLYRHRQETRIDKPGAKQIGFPMTLKTRPAVLSQAEQAIREKLLPDMPDGLISECHSFVYAETNPSPRASEGAHDDRVMAFAITLEMYRRFGQHPGRWKPDSVEREITKRVRVDTERGFLKRYGGVRA